MTGKYQTRAPLSRAVHLKQENAKLVKQNNTFSDSGDPDTGKPTFASTPTRYLNSNQIYGIEQITCDYQALPSYPDFLGSAVPNADFFGSQQPMAANLPSTLNPTRFK